MQTSRKLTHAVMALFALVMMSVAALAADPGVAYPAASEASDQKAGSILVYNFYTSASTPTPTHNTRINVTNTSSSSSAFVHFFFIDQGCSIADFKLFMSQSLTFSLEVSEYDPGVNGWIIAIATDADSGAPRAHNFLIGDAYIKSPGTGTAGGPNANLAAVAFSALFEGEYPGFSPDLPATVIVFNGTTGYNRVPAVLAVSNFPSPADQNSTLVIINRVSGNLGLTLDNVPRLFALVYDDGETPFSSSLAGVTACQKRVILGDAEPRTAPRLSQIVGPGREGWMKIFSQTGTVPILGAMINFNPNTASRGDVFNGGHNLHHLTLTAAAASATLTVPVFPF